MAERDEFILNYDKVISKTVDDETIEYGILYGNEKIVFIKVGADGNIRGYKDKYLKMAYRIHKRLGSTVVCASNPWIEEGHIDADKSVICETATEKSFSEYEVYFVGASDGAHHNLLLAAEISQTVKILGINTSVVDLQDFKNKLNSLSQIKKVLVYGTEDELFYIVPSLEETGVDNLEIKIIQGADHEFRGMLEEYISLVDLL